MSISQQLVLQLEESASIRKARGAFFTPPDLAAFVTAWAVREATDKVLDPSCGEAAFLLTATDRLRRLGATRPRLFGYDIHGPSIRQASKLLRSAGAVPDLRESDFLQVVARPSYDAVVGNPPYIRYQAFSGDARRRGQDAALQHGVHLDGLANSWAAFVVHAAQFLKPDGRLGLVLPAVLLTVNYADPVRRFLTRRFGSVRIIMFRERVFPGVQEEVVLLLAEGQGESADLELIEYDHIEALLSSSGRAQRLAVVPGSEGPTQKWTSGLVSESATGAYEAVVGSPHYATMADWGETDLGIVTGNNKYFVLSGDALNELGLGTDEVLPISPSGRHLRGLAFTERALRGIARTHPVYLFYPGERPSKAAEAYIAFGEELGVHHAYKCRVRRPWWRVPLVRRADLFFTYMSSEAPRLVANRTACRHLNSLHGISLRSGNRKIGQDLLPLAFLNSATLLGAELLGRSYGGGVLKLEPKEVDRLPVPSHGTIAAAADELRAVRPQLARRLRQSDVAGAVRLVDDVLLARHLKVPHSAIREMRCARQQLRERRASRAKKAR